jgi:hypothetical protein
MKTVWRIAAVLLCLVSADRSASAQSFCIPGSSTLCLDGGRFQVDLTWQDSQGQTGTGQVVPLGSDDSGLFWFFSAQNWELLVKVLNGCALNHRFWVFSAATTDVQYTLRVTDTATGQVQSYRNPQGRSAPSITDTSAFNTCTAADVLATQSAETARPRSTPSPSTLSAGPCVASPSRSCLQRERFAVGVAWQDSQGNTGSGSLAPAGSEESSVFWFFAPNNCAIYPYRHRQLYRRGATLCQSAGAAGAARPRHQRLHGL